MECDGLPSAARRRSRSALPRVCQNPLPLVALSCIGISTQPKIILDRGRQSATAEAFKNLSNVESPPPCWFAGVFARRRKFLTTKNTKYTKYTKRKIGRETFTWNSNMVLVKRFASAF